MLFSKLASWKHITLFILDVVLWVLLLRWRYCKRRLILWSFLFSFSFFTKTLLLSLWLSDQDKSQKIVWRILMFWLHSKVYDVPLSREGEIGVYVSLSLVTNVVKLQAYSKLSCRTDGNPSTGLNVCMAMLELEELWFCKPYPDGGTNSSHFGYTRYAKIYGRKNVPKGRGERTKLEPENFLNLILLFSVTDIAK